MPAAARLGDFHICPLETPAVPAPIPHVGGLILGPGVLTVLIGGLPAAVVGNEALCIAPEPDVLEQGSLTVLIGGLPAARVGDATAHGGKILTGDFTVLIGG